MKGGGGGGSGDGGVVEQVLQQARRAAAAARAEPAARLAARQPVHRKYRGVQQRKNRYNASIWHTPSERLLFLGSYVTPEEAAYAFDAAARVIRGRDAKPNFPEPTLPEPEGVSTDLVLALPAPAAAPAPAHRRSQHQHQQQPAAPVVAVSVEPAQQQASFANWLVPASSAAAAGVALAEAQHQRNTSPAAAPALFQPQQQQQQQQRRQVTPFTQFFNLSGCQATAAAAGTSATAAAVNPSATVAPVPAAIVVTPQNVQMPPPLTNPANSALSSTDLIVDTSLSLSVSGSVVAAAPTQRRELPMAQATGVSAGQTVVGDNFVTINVTDDGASSSAAPPPPGPRLTLMLHFDLPDQ